MSASCTFLGNIADRALVLPQQRIEKRRFSHARLPRQTDKSAADAEAKFFYADIFIHRSQTYLSQVRIIFFHRVKQLVRAFQFAFVDRYDRVELLF